METNHEDLIKEDEKDLQELAEQTQKIQKLKTQYKKQKEQIGSLNNIIHQLKNENEQLRGRGHSADNQDNEDNEQNQSDCQDEQFHRKCRIINQNINKSKSKEIKTKGKIINQEKSRSRGKATQTKHFSKTFSNQKRVHLEQQDPEEEEFEHVRPKLWNQKIDKLHRKNTASTCTATGAKFKHTMGLRNLNQDDCPQPSLRNHSGFISSSKLISPQHRIRNQTFRLRSMLQNQNLSDSTDQDPIKLDITNFSTKTKLINNLISDLQLQLKQSQNQLSYQQSSHNHTKSVLEATLHENKCLIQSNNTLLTQFEMLNKQNQYLKKQLVKCMEQKNRMKWEMQNYGEEVRKWKLTVQGKNNWGFQQQMRAMDQIYWQFQNLCSLANKYGKY